MSKFKKNNHISCKYLNSLTNNKTISLKQKTDDFSYRFIDFKTKSEPVGNSEELIAWLRRNLPGNLDIPAICNVLSNFQSRNESSTKETIQSTVSSPIKGYGSHISQFGCKSGLPLALSYLENVNCKNGIHDVMFAKNSQMLSSKKFIKQEHFTSIVTIDALYGIEGISPSVYENLINYIISKKHETNQTFNFSSDTNEIPDDVDCTSLAWATLLTWANHIDTLNTEELENKADIAVQKIINNVNEDGIIQVYLPNEDGRRINSCKDGKTRNRSGRIDAVVCVNALRFIFLRHHRHPETEAFVVDFLTNKNYSDGTLYYPSRLAFFYFLARTLEVAPVEFKQAINSKMIFSDAVVGFCNSNNPSLMNSIDKAMLLYVIKSLKIESINSYLTNLRSSLIKSQSDEGYWNRDLLYKCGSSPIYFASKTVTTTISMRALYESDPDVSLNYDDLAHSEISQQILNTVNQSLIEFVAKFKLIPEKKIHLYVNLVCTYLKHCTPTENDIICSEDFSKCNVITLLGKWLIIFYYLNNMNEHGTNQQFNQILNDLLLLFDRRDITSIGKPAGIHEAAHDFILDLNKLSEVYQTKTTEHLLTNDFQTYISELFTEMKNEEKHRYSSLESALSKDNYMKMRFQTIACKPWFELCRFSMGVSKSVKQSFLDIESLAIHLIIYANDLGSRHIDHKKGKQNLVYSLMKESYLTEQQSTKKILKIHDQKLNNLKNEIKLKNKEERSDCSSDDKKWGCFLQSCIKGTTLSMRAVPDRYCTV